jgi:bifunctional UDP-N-acetylglucosamine pyrophosphorylase/glucosamine-1-phosphate N-acetyltransferase
MNAPSIDFLPLSLTHSINAFPIGNLPLAQHHTALALPESVVADPCAWIDRMELDMFLASGHQALCAADGTPLVWLGGSLDRHLVQTAEHSFLIRHPWDLLRANERYVGALAASRIEGDVHSAAVIEGNVVIGAGTRLLPGVYIEGNIVIGAHCKIGPNCHLRGNTSIGDYCHVGQAVEIKNSIVLQGSHIGHLSYVGDSVIGERVNFGAGTTTSNLRHDGANHRSMVAGSLVDTGRRKFGVIAGDGVHTGIHTVLYPGRKLWPGTTTRPGEIVSHDVVS